ncbi:MAG: hypothetical protein MK186_02860, partial [Henriciella sp.]|nr:hypothetical protein [Henriciella sp.]
ESQTVPAARALFGWTTKPWIGKAVFWGLLVVSVLLIAIEPVLEMLAPEGEHFRHPYFSIDGTLGFNAFWGFGAFTLVVLAGWPLGRLMRRSEDYYEDEQEPAGTEPHP